MKRLSEYVQSSEWSGMKPLIEIANIEVIIEGYTIRDGYYGPVAVMTVILEGDKREQVFTSSKIIIDALKRANDAGAFPMKAIFRKRGRAWQIE